MTANPLVVAQKDRPSRSLDAHCQWLNGLRWVRFSGSPYFIAEREKPEGGAERYLARAA